MWKAIQQFFVHWLRGQFRGNPLIKEPGPYLQKVGAAFRVWIIGVVCCIALAVFGSAFFVIGVIRGWF